MSMDQLLRQSEQLGFLETIKPWLESKKIKSEDLIFLSALKTDLQWQLFLKCLILIIELRASYSEALKTLEMTSDLVLMGHQEALFENTQDFTTWSNHLRTLRYPHTTQRDDELKTKLERLPWPYGSKTKFERRGDRAGIELKMFITSQADLIKAISSLERVSKQISEQISE